MRRDIDYRQFHCGCGHTELVQIPATTIPVHCGRQMAEGKIVAPAIPAEGDARIFFVTTIVPPPSPFSRPTEHIEEVWKIQPGQTRYYNGERFGWVGKHGVALLFTADGRPLVWEYQLVAGVPHGSGFAPSKFEALELMLAAMSGGRHAARVFRGAVG